MTLLRHRLPGRWMRVCYFNSTYLSLSPELMRLSHAQAVYLVSSCVLSTYTAQLWKSEGLPSLMTLDIVSYFVAFHARRTVYAERQGCDVLLRGYPKRLLLLHASVWGNGTSFARDNTFMTVSHVVLVNIGTWRINDATEEYRTLYEPRLFSPKALCTNSQSCSYVDVNAGGSEYYPPSLSNGSQAIDSFMWIPSLVPKSASGTKTIRATLLRNRCPGKGHTHQNAPKDKRRCLRHSDEMPLMCQDHKSLRRKQPRR